MNRPLRRHSPELASSMDWCAPLACRHMVNGADAAACDAIIDTNLTAPFHALRLMLPVLRTSRGAAVLVAAMSPQ
jgi:NAD(P)-dependent dehydrogenase (short-subunit alcohol dehydrogenase family)